MKCRISPRFDRPPFALLNLELNEIDFHFHLSMIACPSRDALQCIAGIRTILRCLEENMMLGYSRIGDQLRSTVETFCACTALPIAAFSDDGTVFGYAGTHLPDALGLDKLRLTHADIKRFISQVDRITWPLNLTVEVNPDLQLTAVPITTGSRSMGMYIIGPFSRTRLRACIPFLLGLLQSIQGSKFSLHDSFPTNLHVRRAVRYVYEHYRETITLESMAAQLGINKSYLAHVFQCGTRERPLRSLSTAFASR